jgi:hypothetical protein
VVPFDVTRPSWLEPQPSTEEPNFVTWEAPDLPAVRVLAPVNVYRPGGAGTTDPPQNFVAYLLGQSRNGARFADRTEATVGGQPATLVTATSARALDGSLGWPAPRTPAHDCFGVQPDLALRIAVMKVHGTTLLIWLRQDQGADSTESKERIKAFEEMLATLRFSDRKPT